MIINISKGPDGLTGFPGGMQLIFHPAPLIHSNKASQTKIEPAQSQIKPLRQTSTTTPAIVNITENNWSALV